MTRTFFICTLSHTSKVLSASVLIFSVPEDSEESNQNASDTHDTETEEDELRNAHLGNGIKEVNQGSPPGSWI